MRRIRTLGNICYAGGEPYQRLGGSSVALERLYRLALSNWLCRIRMMVTLRLIGSCTVVYQWLGGFDDQGRIIISVQFKRNDASGKIPDAF